MEVHCFLTSRQPTDLVSLALGGLQGAAASDVALRAALQEGQGTGDRSRLAVLSQDVLSGGKIGGRQGQEVELLQVQHRLLWALPDSGLFGQETGLATCLLQLRPLLQLLGKEGSQEQGPGCNVVWSRRLWSSTSTTSPPRTCT